MMKFLATVMIGSFAAAALAGAPGWLWNPAGPNDLQDWGSAYNMNAANHNGALVIKTTGKDCRLVLDKLAVNPADYDSLAIYYSTSGFTATQLSGQLYFSNAKHTFTDKAFIGISLKPNVKDAVFVTPLRGDWATGGTVTALRLDAVDQTPGEVVIRGMVLYKKADFATPPALASATAPAADAIAKRALWDAKGTGLADWSKPEKLTATVDGDNLVLEITGADSHLEWKGSPIRPADALTLRITAKAEGFTNGMGPGQLYYINGAHRVDGKFFVVLPNFPNDGQFHTQIVTLRNSLRHSTNEDFENGGDLTGFRYDPTDSAPGKLTISQFEIVGGKQL